MPTDTDLIIHDGDSSIEYRKRSDSTRALENRRVRGRKVDVP